MASSADIEAGSTLTASEDDSTLMSPLRFSPVTFTVSSCTSPLYTSPSTKVFFETLSFGVVSTADAPNSPAYVSETRTEATYISGEVTEEVVPWRSSRPCRP